MVCHHIDWDGLQIKVSTLDGQLHPVYHCLLCDTDMNPEQYKETIKAINEKKKKNTLRFYRTPKGEDHILEECVDDKRCPIHGEDEK